MFPSILALSSNRWLLKPNSPISIPGITEQATNNCGKNCCGYSPKTMVPAKVG